MRYRTQIWHRLKWELSDRGRYTPKPSWYYTSDGWITNSNEIVRAIRLDDVMGVTGLAGKNSGKPTEPVKSAQAALRKVNEGDDK